MLIAATSLLSLSLIGAFAPASALPTGVGVSYTAEGCRIEAGTVLPNNDGDFICPDGQYTQGNLGKGWNELDLVPLRVTLDSGNSDPGTFAFAMAVDHEDSSAPGFDFLSVPVLNEGLSTGDCGSIAVSGSQIASPGLGGADESMYRIVTVTGMDSDAVCVYDAFARLALGSHLYPGASLHFNLANDELGSAGIGAKEVSLPVNEIQPQQLDKTMSAVRDSEFTWMVEKESDPVNLMFGDTCDPTAPLTAPVNVTITWTKSAANPTGYTVTAVVTATNPASRAITVQATDNIYAGNALLDTAVGAPVNVPANSSMTVLTHQFSLSPADLVALGVDPDAPNFNDVATATYTDTVTGIPVPGSSQATASVPNDQIGIGVTTGDSIDLTDSESITGAGLDFSVAAPSVGAFTNYTAGTFTTGPVNWELNDETSSGSITFAKTVRVAGATATSGTLSDTATGTFGGASTTDSASTSITGNPLVDLTINKRRSPVTSEDQTFGFTVKNAADQTIATPSITVPGGTAATTDTSTTVDNLPPGSFTVVEAPTGPYPGSTQTTAINLPACSGSVSFNNVAAPAGARVEKDTVPAGNTVWEFTLSGPDVGQNGTETVNATAGSGYVSFASVLGTDGATYTITETPKAGWDTTGIDGDFNGNSGRAITDLQARTCSFTLDLPDDSGGTFSCSFTNTQLGSITIVKNATPNDEQDFAYTGDLGGFSLDDDGTATLPSQRLFDDLAPGSYSVSETLPVPGWDFTSLACLSTSGASTFNNSGATANITLGAGDSVTCTYTNTKRGAAEVVKTVSGAAPTGDQSFTFQLRSGASLTSPGTILETKSANAGNGGTVSFDTHLVPGQTYQFCEAGLMPGWLTTLTGFVPDSQLPGGAPNPDVDNSAICVHFTVTPGETRVFTVDNTPPPGGDARTIGFWKNWSSCSGGNQDPVLNEVLASFPGGGLMVGDLFVNTCIEAVRILNKSAVTNGKKFASDPLFNMAAQLLAAQLNVQAGAGTCPAAVNAITAGQALLDAQNWVGVPPKGKMKGAVATQANQLAATLDKYNNNTLC